jgi:hypothetical protein
VRALKNDRWRGACEAYLEELSSVVACVHGVLVLAWIAVQLAAIDFDWVEGQAAVGEFLETAVLPLHYSLGASWRLGCEEYQHCGPFCCASTCLDSFDVRFAMAR